MNAKGKVWVQAAIDVEDLELAKKIAQMTVDAGADWVEAGTPLLYAEGIKAVTAMKEIAGDRPVVADFKAQDGCYIYFTSAARHGAQYAVVSVVCNDAGTKQAIRAAKETGIKVIGDLFSVPVADLPKRAKEVEELGVDAVFIHFGMDEAFYDLERNDWDGVAEVAEVVNIPLGVVCLTKEAGLEAIKAGATWIAFGGEILSTGDNFDEVKDFIDTMHNAR